MKKPSLQEQIQTLLKTIATLTAKKRSLTLYQAATAMLGKDASPSDIAPDDVGCAESVSNVIRRVLPDFPVITGTYSLYERLRADSRFKTVSIPMPGTIVISPTGMGNKKLLSNGHVGIQGKGDIIMSNNSYTGKWEANYTTASWFRRYGGAGYPVIYFTLIK